MELKDKLRSMKTANSRGIQELENLFVPVNLRKGVILSALEHYDPILHYIEEGLVIGNYIINQSAYPCWIADSGFIPTIGGFFSNHTIPEFIQVQEETKAWYLHLVKVELLAQKNPLLYKMFLEIFEEQLQIVKEREILLRIPNAYQRFIKFMEHQARFRYAITNALLASLLSINEQHLFKIKRKYAKSH